MSKNNKQIDSNLDLVLERIIDAPKELVWKAITKADMVKQWFAPKPHTVADCEIDLRRGGLFHFVMRSPEGQEFAGDGCILDIVENERLVWTDALLPGYRPAPKAFFTVEVTLEDLGGKTKYTARAMHKDETDRKTHEEMGFHEGWSICATQLNELLSQNRV